MFTDQIRMLGDPALKQKCSTIDRFDDSLARLARSMTERLLRDDAGIGLAANQIGVMRHIFVYDEEYVEAGTGGVLVNPRIQDSGSALTGYEEGCLSIPDFFFPIDRPSEILVIAEQLDGRTVEVEVGGLAARLFQHEIDHLNGLTMFDRIPAEQMQDALAELESVRTGRRASRIRRRRNRL